MDKKTKVAVKSTAKPAPTTTVAPKKPAEQNGVSVIYDLAGQLRCQPDKLLNLLKGTVFRACKRNEEFQMACMVAREYRLNPILKEIYAFPSQNGVVPIISIDGWIRIINSHPKYAGCKFTYEGEITGDGEGSLACTCEIYRTDRAKPIAVQEFYEECYRDTDPWNTMPRRMLRWKSLIQCARVAFGFAGIYDFDEGNDILAHEGKRVTKDGNVIDIPVKPISRDEDAPVDEDDAFEDEPEPMPDAAGEDEPRGDAEPDENEEYAPESTGTDADADNDGDHSVSGDEDMPW